MRRAGAVLAVIGGIALLALAIWLTAILLAMDAPVHEPGALLVPLGCAIAGLAALWLAGRCWRAPRVMGVER